MSGTCQTCKSWNRNGEAREVVTEENDYMPEEVPHRRCLKIIHGNGSGQGEAMKRSDAACLDGSGYAAGLWTKPEFGCNLYEPTSPT